MRKINSFRNCKPLFGLFFLIMSIGVWGQTELVKFPFNSNTLTGGMTYEPTLQTAPPSIAYRNSSHTNITPTIPGGRILVQNMGEYVEISIDTRGFSNISLDFDAFYRYTALAGIGTWNVSYSTTNGGSFQNLSSITIFDTSFLHPGESSDHYSDTLPASADNNQYLRIRITASDFSIFGTSYLYIDNIILTAGNPIINVFNAANNVVPHESVASFLYDTDFGTVLTSSGTSAKTYTIRNTGSLPLEISSITTIGQDADDFIISDAPTSVPANQSRAFTVTFDPSNDGVRTADVVIYSNSAPNPYQFNVQGRGVSCSLLSSPFQQNSFGSGTPSLSTSGTYAIASGNSGTNYRPRNTNMYVNNGVDTRSWITNNNTTQLEFGPVDISNEKNVSISFNVAAFAGGDADNGVNSGSIIDLSVWNPITATWSVEMRLRGSSGGSPRYYYPFFSSTAGLFESTYDGDGIYNEEINSGNTNSTSGKIGTFKLNIPETYGNSLRFRINATTSASTRYWLIDEVKVNTENTVFKTFTTSNVWSPSAPTANEKAIIEGNLTLPAGTYNVCECEVKEGGSLTLESHANLVLQGKLINDGDVVLRNNSNLIQIEDEAENQGDIKVEKLFNFADEERKQYNFVISPVIGQNLKEIFPNNANPTVIEFREPNNLFYNHNGSYVSGKGLSVKEPKISSVPTSSITANFVGEPFNGVLEFPLSYSGEGFGFNLIGNPYPSNLNIQRFYDDNSSLITPRFLFWDNRGNVIHHQMGSDYTMNNYAIFNAASGTGVGIGIAASGEAAPDAPDHSRIPNEIAKVGTAFMIQALPGSNGQTVRFRNEYRSSNNSGPAFFGKHTNSFFSSQATNSEKDRYWLFLTTHTGMEYMNAVVYFQGGTNEYGMEDSDAMGTSDEIFTVVEQQYLAIDGRPSFETTDVVQLGIRHFENGKFQIRLGITEGVFDNGQIVYLKDKYLNVLHDLTKGVYGYESEAGEFIDRFEILYKKPGLTNTALTSAVVNHLKIFKHNQDIVLESSDDKILGVEIFNLSGTSLYNRDNINSKEHRVFRESLGKQILIINLITEKGELVSRKFINN